MPLIGKNQIRINKPRTIKKPKTKNQISAELELMSDKEISQSDLKTIKLLQSPHPIRKVMRTLEHWPLKIYWRETGDIDIACVP